MTPANGAFVKVCFTNGLVESGVVQKWDDDIIVLDNVDSSVVIKNPDDIFIYKIYKQNQEYKQPVSDVYVDKEPAPEKYIRDPALRALDIYELRKKVQEEEARRAREKLTEFKPTGHGVMTQYGDLEVLRNQSILRNTAEED